MHRLDLSRRDYLEGEVSPSANSDPSAFAMERHSLGPLARARWRLAVMTELAEPGLMELAPVRDSQLRIVDFEWAQATSMAANLLDRLSADLAGRRLLEVMPGYQAGRKLFEAYRQVATDAMDLAVVARSLHGRIDSVVVHQVSCSHVGVAVVLTSPSANARKSAAERAVQAMEQRLRPS